MYDIKINQRIFLNIFDSKRRREREKRIIELLNETTHTLSFDKHSQHADPVSRRRREKRKEKGKTELIRPIYTKKIAR